MTAAASRLAAECVAAFAATVLAGLAVLRSADGGRAAQTGEGRTADARTPDVSAAAPFDGAALPSGWTALGAAASVRGWRQSGFAPVPPDDAVRDVDAVMASCGYAARHRVGGGPDGTILAQYESAAGKILWTLRPASGGRTFFSWGISK